MRIGLVVPHIFMHQAILPNVIFSPGQLAISLCNQLIAQGHNVTLFSPGPVHADCKNTTADLTLFEAELAQRGDSYIDLLKKHPLTFISLARQVQSEIIARAYAAANHGEFDILHIYTNEEDIALPFAQFCTIPVVFTHHDPFNFSPKYKAVFPKYARLPWISMSYAQRKGMPARTNWLANIYHGIDEKQLRVNNEPSGEYVAFCGRIIEQKGTHLAIAAVCEYNKRTGKHLILKIAGKHYSGTTKDTYWHENILPQLGDDVEYIGFIKSDAEKQAFFGNAKALIIPSLFEEPFGMVMIEALACGTPLVGLKNGAISEVIIEGKNGALANEVSAKGEKGTTLVDETRTAQNLADALEKAIHLDRTACRRSFEAQFTLQQMANAHANAYQTAIKLPAAP